MPGGVTIGGLTRQLIGDGLLHYQPINYQDLKLHIKMKNQTIGIQRRVINIGILTHTKKSD